MCKVLYLKGLVQNPTPPFEGLRDADGGLLGDGLSSWEPLDWAPLWAKYGGSFPFESAQGQNDRLLRLMEEGMPQGLKPCLFPAGWARP